MFAITSSDVTPQITPCSLHRFVDDLCSVCLLIKGRKSKEVSATTVAAQVEFLNISWTLFFFFLLSWIFLISCYFWKKEYLP